MKHPGFIVEFNKPTKYGNDLTSLLVQLGIKGRRLKHKTSWKLNYTKSFKDFLQFKIQLARAIRRDGSALLFSQKTGECRILTVSANRRRTPHVTKVK
jgi:hypothetical protein